MVCHLMCGLQAVLDHHGTTDPQPRVQRINHHGRMAPEALPVNPAPSFFSVVTSLLWRARCTAAHHKRWGVSLLCCAELEAVAVHPTWCTDPQPPVGALLRRMHACGWCSRPHKLTSSNISGWRGQAPALFECAMHRQWLKYPFGLTVV